MEVGDVDAGEAAVEEVVEEVIEDRSDRDPPMAPVEEEQPNRAAMTKTEILTGDFRHYQIPFPKAFFFTHMPSVFFFL